MFSCKGAARRLPFTRESMALNRHTNADTSSGAAGHLSEMDRVSRYPIPKGPLLVRRLDRPAVRVVNSWNRTDIRALNAGEVDDPRQTSWYSAPPHSGAFSPYWSSLPIVLCGTNFACRNIASSTCPVAAPTSISRSEKQLGGLLPRMPRLGVLW